MRPRMRAPLSSRPRQPEVGAPSRVGTVPNPLRARVWRLTRGGSGGRFPRHRAGRNLAPTPSNDPGGSTRPTLAARTIHSERRARARDPTSRASTEGDGPLMATQPAMETTLRAAVAERLGESRFGLWFGEGVRLGVAEGSDALEVAVPNAFFRDWIQGHFARNLVDAAREVTGRSLRLDFRVDGEARPPSATSSTSLRPTPTTAPASPRRLSQSLCRRSTAPARRPMASRLPTPPRPARPGGSTTS